jgi:hypothetical protein
MKRRKPAAAGLKRGRKPSIAIPMPVRMPYAPLHAMADPELQGARLHVLSLEISEAERRMLAWTLANEQSFRRKGAQGRRKAPAWRNEIETIVIARFYIWAAYAGRAPRDRRGEKDAVFAMETDHKISRRTLEGHLAAAKRINKKNPLGADTWWCSACRLARKGTPASRDKLMRFWPLHLMRAFVAE